MRLQTHKHGGMEKAGTHDVAGMIIEYLEETARKACTKTKGKG